MAGVRGAGGARAVAKKRAKREPLKGLDKCPTGIRGLDEITEGGLPRGRTTLVCGSAGSGKTLLAMEFIVRGIEEFGEPGAFVAFEETPEELARNVASLGFDLKKLMAQKKLDMEYVHVERSEIEETGEYNLEGLFVRLANLVDGVGARRIVIDSIEALFGGLPNEGILRAELRRLFRWLKQRGLTAVVTGEQGERMLTRHGLEEYISDCVIFLNHRVDGQIATRRLRVVKYRGSRHGTNEYPTLIGATGLSVLPITSLGLNHPVTSERISTGVPQLDEMMGGKGFHRGASVLISGTAGSGKTSFAAAFAAGVCGRGGRCLYFSFEESPEQIIRNMRSIGLDLEQWRRKNLLHFHSSRPTLLGLESHLVAIHRLVEDIGPAAVVVDPITNLASVGNPEEITMMLTRLVDFLKNRQITAVFTSLTPAGDSMEWSSSAVSSLMDAWLLLKMVESDRARDRVLYVLKARGIGHSNELRQFWLTDKGIELAGLEAGAGRKRSGSMGGLPGLREGS